MGREVRNNLLTKEKWPRASSYTYIEFVVNSLLFVKPEKSFLDRDSFFSQLADN